MRAGRGRVRAERGWPARRGSKAARRRAWRLASGPGNERRRPTAARRTSGRDGERRRIRTSCCFGLLARLGWASVWNGRIQVGQNGLQSSSRYASFFSFLFEK